MSIFTGKFRTTLLLGLASLAIAGCQSHEPVTHYEEPSSAARFAGTGSAIGDIEGLANYLYERDVPFLRNGNEILVRLPQQINYRVDRAHLSSNASDPLVHVAAGMSIYPLTRATVIGHTDSTGKVAYNDKLSAQRADSVARSLIEVNGIAQSRVKMLAAGEHHPIATNKTVKGKALNRRTEILLGPLN